MNGDKIREERRHAPAVYACQMESSWNVRCDLFPMKIKTSPALPKMGNVLYPGNLGQCIMLFMDIQG